MAHSFYNLYVGARTGLLKGVNVNKNLWINLNSLEEMKKKNDVNAMCWGNLEETEVCFGIQNGVIKTYDIKNANLESSEQFVDEESPLKGLAKYEDSFITGVESGCIKLLRNNDDQIILQAGANLHRMRQNPYQPSLLATGGKENDLKIWDLNNGQQPIFKAKNVPNDSLDLRVPIWILDMQFIPGSQKIITSTGYHHVRIYDPSVGQKRPVLSMEFDEYPLTAVSLTPNANSVIVGNTQGRMALLDLRKGKMVHVYRGFAGSIRSIQCHPTHPMVASCGLDRFLRVHDIHSRRLLHKIYLKSQLNCLLFATTLEEVKEEDEENMDLEEENVKHPEDEEVEEIWEKMEDIKEIKKKRKIVDENDHPQIKKKQKLKTKVRRITSQGISC